ncbi:hypothetical protein SDC9_181546 [bioreactor metagenome]|uniref:Uncharacterized protein n=1 Tax=bioreactor metagenome TaxID=1076179 RepID=A0A645HD84_9ZZZZ
MGGSGHPQPDHARLSQPRAGRDYRRRRDRHDVACRQRGRGRGNDHRRPGSGQCLPDPVVHAAQLPRHCLSRNPPGIDRHRADVQPAARESGNRRCPRCPGTAVRTVADQLRLGRLCLRVQSANPAEPGFRHRTRQDRRRRRPFRRRQIDLGPTALPLLRCPRRRHPHQRA